MVNRLWRTPRLACVVGGCPQPSCRPQMARICLWANGNHRVFVGITSVARDLQLARISSPGKVVEEFTPGSAVDRADMVSFLHTVRYTEEMAWRTMTTEAEAELLGLEKLRNDSSLRISWEGAKEAEVDGIRGLGRWPLAVEVWKKEDGGGLERLQGAQGLRKHQLAARKAKNTSLVHAPVNIDRGVFPGLILSHRGADVTVGYSLRAGNRFAYEVGETMRLSKDGATDAKNELGDTRVAVFFGALAKLCREMYTFVCAPGVAPCLPNILCGGEDEFGPESK
ncbi:hypothetical protein C8F01DRAFT_500843 [Mycena amicta]|nr:hypothetical protein C8F01DRAFT_500843 [Mycena amicta]